MGSSCVRDCERTAHELYQAREDTGSTTPGLASTYAPNGSTASTDVKVGATFKNPLDAIQGAGANNGSTVPSLSGLKWLQQNNNNASNNDVPQESPRFLEMSPRGSVAGEFPTPRDSPRPAEEGKQEDAGPAEVSYEGDRVHNLKHGIGCLKVKGSTYEGGFVTDQKHGQGVLTWDDGRQYRGQFQGGKFHGHAVMTWPDGRNYSGQYADDRKHGEGTFSWQDGRRYQGQWVVGKRHGIGVYTNAKSLTRTGMWEMDRPLHWDAVSPDQQAPQRKDEVDGRRIITELG